MLLDQTMSRKILYSEEMGAIVQQMTASKEDLQSATIESLDSLLAAQGPPFPYRPSFAEAVRHPVVVLHSSGSTGLPKPVVMTHGTFAITDNDRNFPTVDGRENHDLTVWDFHGTSGRIYEPFPPFHLAGFFNKIMVPVFTNAIPVFGPPLRPPSGELAAEIMQQQPIRGCILPPAVAEQLIHKPNGLECFRRLEVFIYAGGPLSQAVGDMISKVTTVCQFYGSTETGPTRQLVPRPEDWAYMEFHPDTKLQFQPSDDDAFELVIFADRSTESSVALNHNYPGIEQWHTKDLFRPHPVKKGLWKFHGRRDDIIVLSSGEKLNPVPIESHLQTSPMVSGALVVGQARFQPALLVELKNQNEKSFVIDKIWPAIESANSLVPSHGRITRSMVLLAEADKPFMRAAKGTIIRKLTEAAYADEIEELYAGIHQNKPTANSTLLATAFTAEAIISLLRSILSPVLQTQVGNADNLYLSGLDSLKSIEVLQALRSSLLPHRKAPELTWLSVDTLYNYPSIDLLSQVILNFLNNGTVPKGQDRVAKMSEIFERFASSLASSHTAPVSTSKADGLSVVLTGTTGSLGSFLLDQYMNDPRVSTVYCLNRSTTAEQQWVRHCSLCTTSSSSTMTQLEFVTINFGHDTFGLAHDYYTRIAEACDLIVHTAWKVDFQQDVSSFADNIRSVCTFANWSILSPRRPRLVFVSSIASVGPWNVAFQDGSSIPEEPIEELGAALTVGYGESKRIAERLLDKAATQTLANISILRVGPIGGATTSTQADWTQRELVPSLIKTSKALALIPDDLPPVDWIPVDTVSRIISDLSFNDIQGRSKRLQYYHVVNPQPVPWLRFIPAFEQHCGRGARLVSLSEWIQKLSTFDATKPGDVALYPALKIVKFFMLVASSGPTVRYETLACMEGSKTMAELKPVDQSLMRIWLKQSM